MMLSMFPNMDDSPRENSIAKKSTAHAGAPGMCRTASAKAMKARPGPEALCETRTRLGPARTHAPGWDPPTRPAGTRPHLHARLQPRVPTPSLAEVVDLLSGSAGTKYRSTCEGRNLPPFNSLQPRGDMGPECPSDRCPEDLPALACCPGV